MKKDSFAGLREEMVSYQILNRGINDEKVLEAFRNIPRHLFVPEDQKRLSYSDSPLPVGCGQTISQPYMVALMTLHLNLSPGMSVLEIGTGSGYQAAILAFLGAQVYTVERFSSLAKKAKKVLNSLSIEVEMKVGDGTLGWLEHSPYDRIIVTAGSPRIPAPFIEQLKIGGRMIIPKGVRFHQNLIVADKISQDKINEKQVCECIFVPLIGEHGWGE